jgi:hypothetical protein
MDIVSRIVVPEITVLVFRSVASPNASFYFASNPTTRCAGSFLSSLWSDMQSVATGDTSSLQLDPRSQTAHSLLQVSSVPPLCILSSPGVRRSGSRNDITEANYCGPPSPPSIELTATAASWL